MTLLRPLALAALAVAGLVGTASAQYPYPQPPIRSFPPATPTHPGHSHSHRPSVVIDLSFGGRPQVVAQPQPVVVQRPVVFAPPPVVVQRPQIPVYCLDTFARDFHPCPGKHHIAVMDDDIG